MSYFKYGEDQLSYPKALQIARNEIRGILTEKQRIKVKENFEAVQQVAKGDKVVYSINTGFGSLCTTKISKEKTQKLQENLLKSHSVGVGEPIDQETAKLMLILKAHALSIGYSGASLEVLDRILWHIENDIIPLVPEQGSVGASGDLAPLAHLFLPLIGLGFLSVKGEKYLPTQDVLKEYNKDPLKIHAKEGLALINGTQFMTANAIKVAEIFENCLEHADLIGALSIEGFLGSTQPFDERLINLRPHSGSIKVAQNVRKYLENSEFVESHKECGRVQDPYSFRCIPQVHGASRDAFKHFNETLELEINSVTDNPIVFGKEDSVSGGNFHGQPIALPLDYLTLAACELGNISDRRTYLLLDGKYGLPDFLIKHSGINSGFMIAQYCSAALVSENKTSCFPASADSIPTSKGQEDHVSMGSISSRKALKAVKNLEKILAIELLCAAQAFDFRRPLKSSIILENIHSYIRSKIPYIEEDTVLSPYIEKAREIIQSKQLFEIIKEGE
ncbi:MAG: Histidine ammonia-lyase [Promethearchaeota archaeon]|nr:MAG: Histidine ammonia-lyase [Candidatus Lokiarchaeota archaeon]